MPTQRARETTTLRTALFLAIAAYDVAAQRQADAERAAERGGFDPQLREAVDDARASVRGAAARLRTVLGYSLALEMEADRNRGMRARAETMAPGLGADARQLADLRSTGGGDILWRLRTLVPGVERWT